MIEKHFSYHFPSSSSFFSISSLFIYSLAHSTMLNALICTLCADHFAIEFDRKLRNSLHVSIRLLHCKFYFVLCVNVVRARTRLSFCSRHSFDLNAKITHAIAQTQVSFGHLHWPTGLPLNDGNFVFFYLIIQFWLRDIRRQFNWNERKRERESDESILWTKQSID